MDEIFLGVMELTEAKYHQLKLQAQGVILEFKTHAQTCTTGCKVTVEVWGRGEDGDLIKDHFQKDYLKHVKNHEPNFDHLMQVFDPTALEVVCQACGSKFAPTANECPECGLVY